MNRMIFFFQWRWDCNVLRRKKALCPPKRESERRLKLLYPLQCHKYCHSKKGPWGAEGWGGELEERGVLTKGPVDWPSDQEAASPASSKRNRVCQLRPPPPRHCCAPQLNHPLGTRGRGWAGWVWAGIRTEARLWQVLIQDKLGSQDLPKCKQLLNFQQVYWAQ